MKIICEYCGNKYSPKMDSVCCGKKECQKQYQKQYRKQYRKSDKYKQYQKSDKYKQCQKQYQKSISELIKRHKTEFQQIQKSSEVGGENAPRKNR